MSNFKYAINDYVVKLPGTISVRRLCEILEQNGIQRVTFFRHRSIRANSKQSIPADKLMVYAQLFNCSMDDLVRKKPRKIKPLL